MPYLIGIVAVVFVSLLGVLAGFERERGFYPVILIAIGTYYVLFGAMTASVAVVAMEVAVLLVFVALATLGFRRNLWVAVAGLALHGIFDFVRAGLLVNDGIPQWWPAFCGTYDVLAAAYVAWLLTRGRLAARPPAGWPRVAPR